jgi:diguanylate cyclase (GGDEF)-like protein
MELKLYFQMLRRGWWIILLTMLTAPVGALGASYLVTSQYAAKARFIISPSSDLINRSDVVSSLNALNNQSVAFTFTEVLGSDRIYTDTLNTLKLQPQDLKDYTYKSTVVSNSSVMEVSVIGPNPVTAAKFANALGSETIKFVSRFNQVYTYDFLDVAVPPVNMYSPKPLLNAGIALGLGLIVGIILALIIDQIRLPLDVFRKRFNYDSMTGVYNKRYFTRCLEDELSQKPDDPLSISIIELMGLSDLIDTLPVASMQKIFQNVTDTLHQELRGNDIIGRWNDISFIVMLPNTSGLAAHRIFERIYQAIIKNISLGKFDVMLDLDPHIGVSEYGNNITAQDLFERASDTVEQARQKRFYPVCVWEIEKP